MTQSGTLGPTKAKTLCAMLLLSLLWTASALRPELLPPAFSSELPPLLSQALALAIAAAGLCSLSLRGRQRPSRKEAQSAIWIGLGLFTAPALTLYLASFDVSTFARTALLTLVPVFSIVLEPSLGPESARPIPGSLAAALAATFGATLIFPLSVPGSIVAAAALACVILAAIIAAAAGCFAVSTIQASGRNTSTPIAAMAVSTGAISLGIAGALLDHGPPTSSAWAPELLWAAVIEFPSLLILFWLMRRVSAVRLAVRFVLAPALTVSAGALLMQIPLAPRTSVGLVAMTAGSAYLLLKEESTAEPASLVSTAESR